MAPALAVSTGLWLQCGLLLHVLHSGLKKNFLGVAERWAYLPSAGTVARQLAAAAATAFVAWRLLELLRGCGIWLELALAISGGATAWLACLLVMRDGDALTGVRAMVYRLRGGCHKQ